MLYHCLQIGNQKVRQWGTTEGTTQERTPEKARYFKVFAQLTFRNTVSKLLVVHHSFQRDNFLSNIYVINPRNYVVSRVLFCAENCLFGDGSRQVDNTIKYFITVEKYEYKTVKEIVFIKLIDQFFCVLLSSTNFSNLSFLYSLQLHNVRNK